MFRLVSDLQPMGYIRGMSPKMQKRVVEFALEVLKAYPPGTDLGHELSPTNQMVVIAHAIRDDEEAEAEAKKKQPAPEPYSYEEISEWEPNVVVVEDL